MKKAICLYLHVHQPFRVKQYSIFDVSKDHEYFNDFDPEGRTNNQRIINKVAEKTYLPTNKMLMDLIAKYPNFNLNLSISGMALEQFELWAPQVLDSFKELIDTKRVEIVTETYHHSLAFFYSLPEFEKQVALHRQKISELFGQSPKVIRNTELSYNNDLAKWADSAGYKGIMAEGWDPILNWRSPDFVYRPVDTQNIKLMLKNYRLSDDIAFRFGDRNWKEWP
jgi:alpha-amylase